MDNIISPDSPELTAPALQALAPYARALGQAKRQPPATSQSASFLNRKKGHGLDLLEVRPYQSSDEVRHMDWRITARTGTPHTRVYTEEIEHKNFVLLNLSPDAYFGTQTTFISTRLIQLAALISWRSQFRREPLGAGLIAAEQSLVVSVIKDWGLLTNRLATLSELAQRPHSEATFSIPPLPSLRGYSLIILSDHLTLSETSLITLAGLAQHNRVYWLEVEDKGVFALPDGQYEFATANGFHRQQISGHSRQQAQRVLQQKQERLTAHLASIGASKFSFDVNSSPINMARELLALGVIH